MPYIWSFCISGFKVLNAPCCPMGLDGMCIRDSKPCLNRNEYIFYDGFHPTSALNYVTALTSYNSSSNPKTQIWAYPCNQFEFIFMIEKGWIGGGGGMTNMINLPQLSTGLKGDGMGSLQ